MTRILIIEDEPPAVKRLTSLLQQMDERIEIVDVIDSVDASIKYLSRQNQLDLIFMDIQLSDGLSFEIFENIKVHTPTIFTTAFDNYMINAFKVHSVDYLLKPIEPEELFSAYSKFQNYYKTSATDAPDILKAISELNRKKYKERFLVKSGNELKYLPVDQIAYFYSDSGYTHLMSKTHSKFIVDFKLDDLESLIDPLNFHRINRKIIVGIDSIVKIENYFNSRLKLHLSPSFNNEAIVSRDRCSGFKNWLDQ